MRCALRIRCVSTVGWSVVLLIASLALPVTKASAAAVAACFAQGRLGVCTEPVLSHVRFKSVVLQFVDPGETELGEGLARILWREILESISNVAGAGVILAYDREGAIREALGGRDYNAFLAQEYHAAAERIAEQQNVQMSIWGVVLPDGDDLYLQSFLTLHANEDEDWTSLSLGEVGDVEIAAAIGRHRLNLAPMRATREALFVRPWTTRCALESRCPGGVDLRDKPSNDGNVVEKVPVGSVLKGQNMFREWLQVERPDGGTAYINVYHVEMFPDRISFSNRKQVNIRSAAGVSKAPLGKVDLNGEYEVLAGARAARQEPWYQISAGGQVGWVAGRLVERRNYHFPAVHLIAGLYRYARGDFSGAERELEIFLNDNEDTDNVTRAIVHQFLAASRVAMRRGTSGQLKVAIEDLDEAVRLTPYDPGPYRLRAVVRLGGRQDLGASLADLGQALALDRRDVGSQRLLGGLLGVLMSPPGLNQLAPGEDTRAPRRQLLDIGESYADPQLKEVLEDWQLRTSPLLPPN